MQPDDETPRPETTDTAAGRLVAAARGWHRIQLAVLGFVGLCGVLWAGGDPAGPRWLQWLAGTLVLLALLLACLAIFLVGRVANPLHEPVPDPTGGARQLRTGVRLTYVAVAVLAAGSLSGWWPAPAAAETVRVSDASGGSWCGELTEAPPGAVRLDTADGPVTVPLGRIADLRPAGTC